MPFLITSSLLLFGCQTTQAVSTSQERTSTTSTAQVDEGLFKVHQTDGKIFYEIPESLLGRDLAILSRIAKTAEGLGWGGGSSSGSTSGTVGATWS
ncbi:MAG: DUF5118 domain-containing protein [Balneola sp.]